MGKRKFKLAVRKNHERKKYQKQSSLVSVSSETIDVQPVLDLELIINIPRSIYSSATAPSLHTLYLRVSNILPKEWTTHYVESLSTFTLSKAYPSAGTLLVVSVTPEFSWSVRIGMNKLEERYLLKSCSTKLSSIDTVMELVACVDNSQFCIGNADEKFARVREHHKDNFKDRSGKNIVAYIDNRLLPSPTIRHTNCPILVNKDTERCIPCDEYRSTLHSLASREKFRASKTEHTHSSHVNYRYLTTPEKNDRLKAMRQENRALQLKINRLEMKLAHVMETTGVVLDEETSSDFQQIMAEKDEHITEKFPKDSFQAIFWEQQKKALTKEGTQKKGIRWHPLIIKWCIYLRHQSSKAYEMLRESGCISLPSQRTLRDYTHCVKAGVGFLVEVDRQLMEVANLKSNPAFHSLIIILFDEMHIKEDLVYDKYTGKMIGFVDLGDINNHLAAFEKSLDEEDESPVLANSMMVMMVRGLFTKLQFAYAQFPCTSILGEQLFRPFWETVLRLERMGFKVLGTTCDGGSPNRRFVAVHDTSDKLIYKLRNIYAAEERYIYIFSDPPHLMKTTRNCWSSNLRNLWNNGKSISWQHLIDLYERDQGKGSGLAMVPKLKFEHIYLTSFSKMRVDLATQVLSESVGKAIQLTGRADAEETSKFVLMFDKFFDIFNVTNFTNWARYRKPFQYPYRGKDHRLDWLEKEFLPYLDAWEESVNARSGFTEPQKRRMLLSTETLLGIRRTVKSFIEFIRFLFTLPEVQDHNLAFLSNHLCQDPLESFFGCQRQRGGTSDNPTVKDYYNNTQALRIVNSFCRGPIRGNCRGGTCSANITPTKHDLTPLSKRKCVRKSV